MTQNVSMVGVDVGGTKILAGAVTSDGAVLRSQRIATPHRDSPELGAVQAIATLAQDVIAGLDGAYAVGGVGVGVAAYVSADRSMAMFAPHLPFRRFQLRDRLEQILGLPVVIENDANAAIWAEFRFGAAARADHVLGVTVGTGVGGAAILSGHLHRGANGMAAEFGHLRVMPDGRPCMCGLRGCWEQYASGSALTRAGRDLVRSGDSTSLVHELSGGEPEKVTGPMVSEAARAGDAAALRIFDDLGDWLGAGLASLTALFDPEVIVVGGGLTEVSDLFLDRTRESFAANLTGRSYRELPDIAPAQLGQDAGFLGAADLAATGG